MINTIPLSDCTGLTLLDVRPAVAFEQGHLPQAVNNCVFEVQFLSRIPEEWSKEATLVITGQSAESQEAVMAAEKLERLGFSDVRILEGGMDAAGFTFDTEADAVPDGKVEADLGASELQWTGRNLLNRHYGTLGFKNGHFVFKNGQWVGGGFEVDWDSLACTDLAGCEMHSVLISHLKDHDFFDVEAYAAPKVQITSVTPLDSGSAGAPTVQVEASLTLKGITRPLSFQAVTGQDPEGRFAVNGSFSFDRTNWNVRYGSGKLFRNLGMHLVNDRIEVGLNLVAAKG